MKNFALLKCLIFCLLMSQIQAIDDLIIVNKKGIEHRFVKFDAKTDHFTQNIFWYWENETFEIFDQVKNKEGIAIDLGAWIGTTSIWLANNFHHVVAVAADRISLECLTKNLEASDCLNVSICERAIAQTGEKIIFGPRGVQLNESISSIKNEISNENDYEVKGITFKQLLFDYVYANEQLNNRNISFIKCDIEGGEEEILEDILHFAYNNHCPVYLSFHLDWWNDRNIGRFEDLFAHFNTNCPSENVTDYLHANPFASLLFQPRSDAGVLVKKNMPAFVIGYNQYTFIKNMVDQLKKYTTDIIVVDNNSDYQPLLDYYRDEFCFTLLKQKVNYGYKVYERDCIQRLAGDLYILTDPDLEFNPNLPDDFIQDFIDISNEFKVGRIGFALLIDSDDIRTDVTHRGYSIQGWESQFWENRLISASKKDLELYLAPIDTTFCLINRRYGHCIRVAGDYTCKHIPWHKDFHLMLQEGEKESYMKNNRSTNWFN